MEDTDLSFEYSEVEADVKGHVISIKNPKAGIITVDSVGEIIKEAPVMECLGEIVVRGNNEWYFESERKRRVLLFDIMIFYGCSPRLT